MKAISGLRFGAAFACVCLAALICAPGAAQNTTVSASHAPGASATIYLQPVVGCNGGIGAARIGSSSGQIQGIPFSATVTSGAFSLSIPDALATSPNIAYAVTIIDNASGQVLLGAGLNGSYVQTGGPYGCVQPTGSTWSFDTYIPGTAVTVLPSNIFATPVVNTLGAGSTPTATIAQQSNGQYLFTFGIPAAPISTAQLSAALGTLTADKNVFDANTVLTGHYLDGTTGSSSGTATGYFISAPILATAGSTITASFQVGTSTSGWACFDVTGTYISGANGPITANTPITTPSGTFTCKLTGQTSALSTAMVAVGSSLPSVYTPYSLVGVMNTAQLGSVLANQSVGQNLFNSAAAQCGYYLNGTDGTFHINASYCVSNPMLVAGLSQVTANYQLNASTAGYVFTDARGASGGPGSPLAGYISGANGAVPAGTSINVPANAVYMWATSSAAQVNSMAVASGTNKPPFSAFGPAGMVNASQLHATLSSLPIPKNLFDSTSADVGHYTDGTDGSRHVNGFYVTSNAIYVAGATTVELNVPQGGSSGGYYFADASGGPGSAAGTGYISGSNGLVTAGTAIAVPQGVGAVWFYATTQSASLATTAIAVDPTSTPTWTPFGTNGMMTSTQAAALTAALPIGQNRFNSDPAALFATGQYADGTSAPPGNQHVASSYYIGGPVFVGDGTQVISNKRMDAPTAGYYCLDKYGTFIAGANGTINKNTPLTLPAGCWNFYFTGLLSDLANPVSDPVEVVMGSTLPPFALPFVRGVSEATAAATYGKKIFFNGDSITALHYCAESDGINGWCTTVLHRLGLTQASMDARPGRWTYQAFELYGGGDYAWPALNGTITSCSSSSGTVTVNGTFPEAYPAGTLVRNIGLSSNCAWLLPLVITVNSGATVSSFSGTATYGGASNTPANVSTVSDSGTALPIIPNGTITAVAIASNKPTFTGTFAQALPSGTVIAASGLTSFNYLVSSLSTVITCTVDTGATTSSIPTTGCLSNGASWTHVDVGSTSDSGTLIVPGHNQGCFYNSTQSECAGTPSNTFAADMQAINPDIFLVGLNTNDCGATLPPCSGRTIGSSSDLATAGTEYGDVKAVVESVESALPTVHLIWWTSYLKSRAPWVNATLAALKQYGVAACDAMDNTTMDTPITWPAMLDVNHVHPGNINAENYLGGYLAECVKANY